MMKLAMAIKIIYKMLLLYAWASDIALNMRLS